MMMETTKGITVTELMTESSEFPFTEFDSVSPKTVANVESMRVELNQLRDSAVAAEGSSRARSTVYEARLSALASQALVVENEVVELQAILEAVDQGIRDDPEYGELRDLVTGVDNSALREHEAAVRDRVLDEAMTIILSTPLDAHDAVLYERVLADAAERIAVAKAVGHA